MPTFSFIIIGRTEDECAPALASLGCLQGEKFEVVLALGSNPSEQRNQGAAAATGDYLVFLDNDSRVDARLLHYFRDALAYEPNIRIVGGPSIYEGTHSFLKHSFQAVFSSVFGLGPFRARYSSIGVVRASTENELILCNLMVERRFFLEEGGFNTNLYPNEENEFLNRVRERAKVYYHPLAVCYRDPRETLRAFAKQMVRYGRGRAKHQILYPTVWSSIFLIPPAFTIYALSLFALPWLMLSTNLSPMMVLTYAAPFAAYSTFNLAATLFATLGTKRISMILALPFLFFMCHFLYGFGFLEGLAIYPFARRERPSGTIRVLKPLAFVRSKSA